MNFSKFISSIQVCQHYVCLTVSTVAHGNYDDITIAINAIGSRYARTGSQVRVLRQLQKWIQMGHFFDVSCGRSRRLVM